MKLVQGGLSKYTSINGVKVIVVSRESLPFSVEVMVFEEDTHLILTADREIYYQEEHPIRLMTDIMNAGNERSGSVVDKGRSWYAVVINVDAEVICQPLWVSEAYVNVFERLFNKKILSAGIALLGNIHGKMQVEQAVGLFLDGLKAQPMKCLKNIYLVVPALNIKATRKEINQHLFRSDDL